MATAIQQIGGPVVVNHFYRHTVYCGSPDSQIGMFGFDVQCLTSSGTSPVALGDCALDTLSAINVRLDDWMAAEYNIIGVKVADRATGVKSLSGIAVNDPPIIGDASSPGLPTQVSGLIRWVTDFAGAAGRGRSYIPFPSVDWMGANGFPTNEAIIALNAIADAIRAAIPTVTGALGGVATFQQIIWNPISPEFAAGNIVKSYLSEQKFATQRRRGNFGKVNAQSIT